MIFSAPLFLLAGLVAFPFLVFIYRRKEHLKEKLVPSLFFLRNIPHAMPSSRKLKLPLRLLFELIIASLFIFYLSGLSLGIRSERALILVDTSLSSGCTLISGESCFTSLIRSLEESLSSGFVYTVMTSSDNTPRAKNVSLQKAIEILQSLTPEYSDTPLTVKDGEFDHIFIVSDSKIITEGKIHSVTLENERKSNCALASLTNDALNIICTKVLSHAELIIEEYDGEKLSQVKTLSVILKNEKNIVSIKDLPKIGRILFKSNEDGNSLDNELWFSNISEKPEIAIYSPLSLSELGVSALKRYLFVDKKTPKTVAQIFHRQPTPTSDLPFLEVLPQGCAESKNSVSRWDTKSRALKFLSFEEFHPSSLCITTRENPLIFAEGDIVASQGDGVVSLGFEIFPFEGANTPRESILLVNILEGLLIEQSQKQLNEKPAITTSFGKGTLKKPGIYGGNIPYNFFSESESLSLDAPHHLSHPGGSKNLNENSLYYILIALIITLLVDIVLLARRIV